MNMDIFRRSLALVVVLAVLAAGCGSSDDTETASADAFSGLSVTVGSKNFTEQYVLAEILLQALSARGAEVVDASDTGDNSATRQALLDGDIDAYWEYNSTGWVVHLGQSDPAQDGEELTEDVAGLDLSSNNIVWVGRSSFNDTYGFAASPEVADETLATRFSLEALDLEGMAEYLENNPERIVCIEPDFSDRNDGLPLFEDRTGFSIPQDQLRVIDDEAAIYQETADGNCDFGEVFTTDGRIDQLGLTTVVDPGVFYVYNVSLTLPKSLYDQAPEAFDDLVADILNPMSQSRITDLNGRVSAGEPVAEVAKSFLNDFNVNP